MAALSTSNTQLAQKAHAQSGAVNQGALHIARFELATGIEAREPVGTAVSFAQGTKIYAFLELKNKGGPETALFVRFERADSKPRQGVRLLVPSASRHRTFAFSANTKKAGAYHCIITTEDGTLLAEKSFEVVADVAK